MAHTPTKSDFHLGKRFLRLFPQTRTQGREANRNGASQELLQHLSGIHRIHIPLAPILCFWNLRIQHRAILSDVFALFDADFFFDFRIPSVFGIVKHIKVNAVSLALGFCQKSVFLFRAGADTDIMLRYTHQHIFALAYVNNLPIQLDTVNAGMLILWGKPPAAQHGANIFFIGIWHFFTPFESELSICYLLILTYILYNIF